MRIDTNAKAVQRLAMRMDGWSLYAMNEQHRKAQKVAAATLRTLAAERDEAVAVEDQAVGRMHDAIAEGDALRAAAKEITNEPH